MPSLYGNTSTSYTVTASNVSTLYMASSSTSFTATTYSTNLAGLYGGSYAALPTNVQQLFQFFDNNGTVQFYLDPLTNSSTIAAYVTPATQIGNYQFNGDQIRNILNDPINFTTNNLNWYLDTNGNIIMPGQGVIGDTYGDGLNNLSLQAGPGGYAGINSNNQQQFIELNDTAVYIGTGYPNDLKQWSFNPDGTTSFPNYLFPTDHGLDGQVLVDNGSGVLFWSTATNGFDLSTVTNQGLFTTSSVIFKSLELDNSTFASTSGVLLINASGTSTYQAPSADGYLFWGINKPGTSAYNQLDTYSNTATQSSRYATRRARGTAAAPTAVQTDDSLARFQVNGYGTTQFSSTATGRLEFLATENWTDTARGTKLQIWANDEGTTTPKLLTTFRNNGIYIYTTATDATQSMVTIVGSGVNSSYEPATAAGTLLWGINQPTLSGRLAVDTYGTGLSSRFEARAARGTSATPTAVQQEDSLGRFQVAGYGTTQFSSSHTGRLEFIASENWTDSAHGTKFQIWAADEGKTIPSLLATFKNNGTYIFTTNTDATQSMLTIDGVGPNTGYEPAATSGTLIWGINKPNTAGRLSIDTYRDPSTSDGQDKSYWTGRRARGTSTTPTAVQNGDALLRISGYGYNGTEFASTASAGMTIYAAENFSNTASSGRIIFDAMAPGYNDTAHQQTVLTLDTNNGAKANKFTIDSSSVITTSSGNTEFFTTNTDAIDLYTDNANPGFSEVWIKHNDGVYINTDGAAQSWRFDNTGTIVFPDNTFQRTAWTGTVANFQITSVSTSKVTGLSVIGYTGKLVDGIGNLSTSRIDGLSIVGYTNNYNDLNNKPTNQALFTTSSVTFGSIHLSTSTYNSTSTLTFPDGTIQVTAWTGTSPNPFDQSLNKIDFVEFGELSLFPHYASTGTVDTFPQLRFLGTDGFLRGAINWYPPLAANQDYQTADGIVEIASYTSSTLAVYSQLVRDMRYGQQYLISNAGIINSGTNFIINLKGSTFTFSTGTTSTLGSLTFPDGTIQRTAFTGTNAGSNFNISTVTNQALFTTSTVTFGSVTATNGLYSVGTYNGAYTDGIVVDYTTGRGRVSVGSADALGFYTGGVANTAMVVMGSGGTTVTNNLSAGATTLQSLVVTTGTLINQTLSAGGYQLDSNGQALLLQGNTQSPSLLVSNYSGTSGGTLRGNILVRSWGQNLPSGTSSTSPAAGVTLDGARGTPASPTAVQSGDSIGTFSVGGYDGANYSTSTNLQPFQLVVQPTETFIAGTGGTTNNAGTKYFFRIQPQFIKLTSTSRQNVQNITWTTATNAPPILTYLIGSADNTAPTLTSSDGANTYTGYGRTQFNLINGQFQLFGVPGTDSAPDNSTLTGTNVLNFISGRRSGVSGRRDALQSGDNLGSIQFFGQTATGGSGGGSGGTRINAYALENFTATTYGTGLNISTINTGTTTVQSRLNLTDKLNSYTSDAHVFTRNGGALPRQMYISTSTTSINSDNIQFNNYGNSAFVPIATFTTSTVNISANSFNMGASAWTIPTLTGVSGTAGVVVGAFDTALYSTGKFIVTIKDSGNYESVEVLLVSNGTSTNITVYAVVTIGTGVLGTFSSSMNGTLAQLTFVPVGANNMTIKSSLQAL